MKMIAIQPSVHLSNISCRSRVSASSTTLGIFALFNALSSTLVDSVDGTLIMVGRSHVGTDSKILTNFPHNSTTAVTQSPTASSADLTLNSPFVTSITSSSTKGTMDILGHEIYPRSKAS